MPEDNHKTPNEPNTQAVKPIDLSDLASLPDQSVFANGSERPDNESASVGNVAGGGRLPSNWRDILRPYAHKKSVQIGLALSGITLIIVLGVAAGLFMLAKRPQLLTDSSKIDKSTLYLDTNKHTVGVNVTTAPDGLQVGATVSTTPQAAANVRLGLVNATDPTLIFDDGQKNTWQVLGVGGSLQFIQGTTVRSKLDQNALSLTNALNVGGATNANGGLITKGNTTLGDSPASVLTVQGNSVAIPNNLSFNNNTLFLGANGTVAIGAASSSGYKLLVAGSQRVNGTIFGTGQVLATAGSVGAPSFSFNNNSNTGLYEPGLNVVGISAGGVQVVQVQQGVLLTVNGANIEADGYVRAGRAGNNPAFRVARFTGTLDGSGSATVADGLSTGYDQVLVVQAFYQGGGSSAVPLNVDYVSGGSFQLSGGVAGRPFRASIIYSQDNAGW